MSSENLAGGAREGSKLKVFVSYSRKDATFAAELVSGLELCGFDAYLDKEDIAPGELWEARLGRLIREADTIVFVLSPSSIASKHCDWEVAETVRLSKRIVPVVLRTVPDSDVPEELRRLNYIFFTDGHSFTKSLGDLASALRTDLNWIRQHTRFGELAANWEAKDRPASLLLLSGEIPDAKAWLLGRPEDAPQITIEQQAFIEASIRAAEEEQKRDAALQWRAKADTIAAAVIFAVGGIVATTLWLQTLSAKNELKERVEELRAANLRLNRNIALRVAPAGDRPYFVRPNWYQIASDYSGAIAVITRVDYDYTASGFIVRGSALYAPWGDEPVFVTSYHIINSNERLLSYENARASFPGLGPESPSISFEKILWEGSFDHAKLLEGHDATVLRIKGPLPFGAKPIEKATTENFENMPDVDLSKVSIPAQPLVPLAMIGFEGAQREGEEKVGFALFLNNLVGVAGRDSAGKALNLAYTEPGRGGTSGSPVFNVETGELVAIHHLGVENGLGAGTAIASVIAEIKKDLGE